MDEILSEVEKICKGASRGRLRELALQSPENLGKALVALHEKKKSIKRNERRESERTYESIFNSALRKEVKEDDIIYYVSRRGVEGEIFSDLLGKIFENAEGNKLLNLIKYLVASLTTSDVNTNSASAGFILSCLTRMNKKCVLDKIFIPEASEYLKLMLKTLSDQRFYLEPLNEDEFTFEHYEGNLKALENYGKLGYAQIYFPTKHKEFIKFLYDESYKEEEEAREIWKRLIERIDFSLIEQKREVLMKDIKENWRRELRSRMLDKVKITIPELNALGLNGFSFIKEGYRFPECGIKFNADYHGIDTGWTSTLNENGNLENFPDYVEDKLKKLVEYIVVDSYHDLVVKYEPEEKIEKMVAEKRELNYIIEIPAKKRRLPDGYKASEDAKARAIERGINLGKNETFVREYYLGVGELMAITRDYSSRRLKDVLSI